MLRFQFILWLSLSAAFGADLPAPPAAKTSRVVVVKNPLATEAFTPRPDRVQDLLEKGLKAFTQKDTVKEAVLSLVTTQDTVGIKVYSTPGATTGTRPAVVDAFIQALLAAGLRQDQILIWDKRLLDLRLAGFTALADKRGVRVAGAVEEGWDETAFYENELLGKLVWGDFEFGKKGEGIGRKSYVSRLITKKMTKIVQITPLLNHNLAGVSGNLLSLSLGSVDNVLRFELDTSRLARAIPEIYALPALGDRVVLNIVDGLICQYLGEEQGLLHYSVPLNELRFSADPVALDVTSIEELERQRQKSDTSRTKPNFDIYQNAALLEIGVADPKHIIVDRPK